MWVGKSEGKRPLGRHKRRWENNEMHVKGTGWEAWSVLISG
jgi:hypothetical protein